jgi:DMSO/TMAO reductase YedYZ molybdopterin-dependent catalytic subunit
MLSARLRRIPVAVLAGLIPHYLAFYFLRCPLWTETIAEWIMARTPSHYAVMILAALGPWAKPLAMTGALATLGLAVSIAVFVTPTIACAAAALAIGAIFHYTSWIGQLSFWIPAALVMQSARRTSLFSPPRREFLTSVAMLAGVAAVAIESFARNAVLARRAIAPVDLFPFHPPADRFGQGLVRKPVTPIAEFYGMSKDAVDPAIDPREWRLKITCEGRLLRQLTYAELLSLPRVERYVTLRCISNTLQSDLMGTAAWSGVRIGQLVDRAALPTGIVEVAVIGVDGHGDSFPLDYAFSDEPLLALGMNGKTLDRTHGFPLRLLSPRYYGFKNVKWISEIAFVSRPYVGTWPKLGYTKEPLIHTASHIDRIERVHGELRVGGVSFAGVRGIRRVIARAGDGPWIDAAVEQPLSPYCWTRWRVALPDQGARRVEARSLDGSGRWQESAAGQLFPDGVSGPTIRNVT